MKIIDVITGNKPSLSFEVFPPKTDTAFDSVFKATEELAALKPNFMSVTYGAGGGTSAYTAQIAKNLQDKFGVPTLAHLTCVSSTKNEIQNQLQRLKEYGITNILALRGDIPENMESGSIGIVTAYGGNNANVAVDNIVVTSNADSSVLYSEDFSTTPTADYTDPDGNYDVAIANGKLDLYCIAPSKLYRLPVELKGLTKFTIVFDWEVVNTIDPTNPGHTLYGAFGIKDAENGVYVGYSHVNGTEHVGTVDNGTFNRAYRTHYSEPSAEKTVGKTLDAVKDMKKIRIKIEVEDGVTRTYVNGKREFLNETEDWRDMDKVGTITHDGYIGFTSRGTAFEALIDYIAVYAGVGITSIDDLPEPDADTMKQLNNLI